MRLIRTLDVGHRSAHVGRPSVIVPAWYMLSELSFNTPDVVLDQPIIHRRLSLEYEEMTCSRTD